MSNEERKEGESYLDPNAVAFQPYPSPSLQFNQFFVQPDIFQPHPFNNYNVLAPNFVAAQFYPQQQNIYTQQAPVTYQQTNLTYPIQKQPGMDNSNVKKYRQQAKDASHARNSIIYDVYELKESTIANLNYSNKKSQSTQPNALTASDTNFIFLNFLVSGYCRKFRIPVDLLIVFVKYCGHKVSGDELAVGINENKPGFYCINFGTGNNVKYFPNKPYQMKDHKILTTAAELILPSHIINYYNALTQKILSKYTRFNAMFLTPKIRMDYNVEIFCILFNNEHALELKLPPFKCTNLYHLSATYSSKYGLMVCARRRLLSFCWDTWRWSEIEKSSKAFERIPFMHFLETQNEIFSYCNNTQHGYLYDMNDATTKTIKYKYSILERGAPIFCVDHINERIFAFQTVGKKHGRGLCIYFDIKTCQWKKTNFTRFPNKRAGMVNAIWFNGVDQTLYAFTKKTKQKPVGCWKYCTFAGAWKVCEKYGSLMRTNYEYMKIS